MSRGDEGFDYDPRAEDLGEDFPDIPESSSMQVYDLEKFTEGELREISDRCMEDYRTDWNSLSGYFHLVRDISRYTNLNIEKIPDDDTPWDGYPNIKLPTITFSVLSLSNRTMSFFSDQELVKIEPITISDDDQQLEIERKLADGMTKVFNYTVVREMKEFYTETKRAIMSMFMNGNGVKCVDWNPIKNRAESMWVKPDDFIVNYNVSNIDDAKVITRRRRISINDLKILMAQGYFREVTVADIHTESSGYEQDEQNKYSPYGGSDIQNDPVVYIQYRWLVLDSSGIGQPVIVYLLDNGNFDVLRIENRLNVHTFEPIQPFTVYNMIDDPTSWVGIGLGALLINLVDAQNMLMNLALAAIQLTQTKGGFASKRANLGKNGFRFRMGEFIQIPGNISDLKNEIMEMQFSPASDIIFKAIDFIQKFIDRLTTVTELFTGAVPRSDTSATASHNAYEQGSKNLVEIQRDISRKFQNHEAPNIIDMITLYFDTAKYVRITGDSSLTGLVGTGYTTRDFIFIPIADPNIHSRSELIQIAQAVTQHVSSNPYLQQSISANMAASENYLKALGVPRDIMNKVLSGYKEGLQQVIQKAQQSAFEQGKKVGGMGKNQSQSKGAPNEGKVEKTASG